MTTVNLAEVFVVVVVVVVEVSDNTSLGLRHHTSAQLNHADEIALSVRHVGVLLRLPHPDHLVLYRPTKTKKSNGQLNHSVSWELIPFVAPL